MHVKIRNTKKQYNVIRLSLDALTHRTSNSKTRKLCYRKDDRAMRAI